jgi:hypothetical protein
LEFRQAARSGMPGKAGTDNNVSSGHIPFRPGAGCARRQQGIEPAKISIKRETGAVHDDLSMEAVINAQSCRFLAGTTWD